MQNFLDILNPQQYEAVTLPLDVHGAIVAGAGTGKTRVLVHRIAHLIQQGIDPSRITAVTFTNKAAKEMRERVSSLVGDEQAQHIRLGTFHSIGLKIIRRHGLKLGLKKPEYVRPLDEEDACALLRRVMKKVLTEDERDVIKPAEAFSIISGWKDHGLTPGDIEPQWMEIPQLAHRLYAPYEEEKTHSNTVDFGDMIFMPVRLLRANPIIAQKMHNGLSQVMIDEFQDTNPLQLELISLLTNGGRSVPTFVVGDDDQSIYSWRGADAGIFKNYLDLYVPNKLVRLEQNYRCSSMVLDAANAVIANNTQRIEKTLFTQNPGGNLIKMNAYRDAESEANSIVSDISGYIKNGEQPDHIAILYRKNQFSRLFEHAFLRNKVPYKIYGGMAFYARKEIKDALAYLRLVHDNADDDAFVRASGAPPKGIGPKMLNDLRELAKQKSSSLWDAAFISANQKLRKFVTDVKDMALLYDREGLAGLVAAVLEQSQLREYYMSKEKEKGEERAENLNELLTASRIYHHDYHMGQTNASSIAPKPGDQLSEFLTDAILDADGAGKSSNREPAVQMMSIHKAKGLEFDRVFVVAVEEGEFPAEMSTQTMEGLEEERRLFYVAMTRAKKHLSISYTHHRLKFSMGGMSSTAGPSIFIDEVPEHLYETDVCEITKAEYSERCTNPSRKPNVFSIRQESESESDLW